jgi:hypothetical protein
MPPLEHDVRDSVHRLAVRHELSASTDPHVVEGGCSRGPIGTCPSGAST